MLKHKTYEFSVKGLENAISDRHSTLRIRKTLIIIGVIGLISIISPSTASIIAFRTL